MSAVPRMLLTTLWQEVGQPVEEEPDAHMVSVLRMDNEALILETNAQSSIFMGLAMLVMSLTVLVVPAVGHAVWHRFAPRIGQVDEFLLWLLFGTALFAVFLCAYATWFLYLGLIRPAPSPVIFNRKTGKVYGSHRGRPLELDWKHVRPVLTKSKLFLNGIQTFYNLVLFQPDSTHEWLNARAKRGRGLIVTGGHAWGWGTCHQLWEFIRRYMDENPEQAAESLPPVEIASPTEGWASKVLDQGPYHDATPEGNRMQRLRERRGRPEINVINTVYVTFMGPGSLMCLLMTLFRRKAVLPQQWWPHPAATPRPYQILPPRPEDAVLRKKAAKQVAMWLLVTVGSGCALWGGLAWLVVQSA